jgi:hypothetical protein
VRNEKKHCLLAFVYKARKDGFYFIFIMEGEKKSSFSLYSLVQFYIYVGYRVVFLLGNGILVASTVGIGIRDWNVRNGTKESRQREGRAERN